MGTSYGSRRYSITKNNKTKKYIPVLSFKINSQKPLYYEVSSTWLIIQKKKKRKKKEHIWSMSTCVTELGDVTHC